MEVGATLQLLYKYVNSLPSGEIDTSGILSRECYLMWLNSRNPRPKQPEEAFRKIIAAHCTGGSGMQPFSKAVEVSLLKHLRRKRVWDCFIGTECNIGLRGFKATGYWEKSEQREILSKVSKENNTNTNISYNLSVVDSHATQVTTDSQIITSIELQQSETAFSEVLMTNTPEARSLAAFVNLLSKYQSPELAQLFKVLAYKRCWFKIFIGPGRTPKDDIRKNYFINHEFIYPNLSERIFESNRKVGCCFGHITLLKALGEDENMKMIYKGSIVGVSAISLRVFPKYTFLHQEHVLHDLFTTGQGWSRSYEYRFDGKPIVLLKRYTFLHNQRGDFGVLHCQDITYRYQNLIE